MGPDGNLWFYDIGTTKAIGRITPAGVITEYSAGLNAGGSPYSLAAGPDGNVWFTDNGTTKAIGRITPAGVITEYTAGLSAGFQPNYIWSAPDGHLWFDDLGTTHGVGKINPSTDAISEYSAGLNTGSEPESPYPTGPVGADGNLWWEDLGTTHAIVRVAIGGPVNTALPSVSGSPAQGQTLTAATGTWTGTPAPSFTYQWQDCNTSGASCVNIAGATASSYTLVASDVGQTVDVVVSGTNSFGTGHSPSAVTATVAGPPVNTAVPAISGTVQQGQTLSATNGTWAGYPAPSFTYQWQDCNSSGAGCTNISGATASSYVLVAGDVGSTIRVTVTATNSGGAVSASTPRRPPWY